MICRNNIEHNKLFVMTLRATVHVTVAKNTVNSNESTHHSMVQGEKVLIMIISATGTTMCCYYRTIAH
jgi:hypothetical protein